MGLLGTKSYLRDPAICVGAIDDANHCDPAPFQVGQFESGIEIENDLTNLWLDGRGCGQKSESYELALYFLARMTRTDAWEKRQKRGYAFIIGDEMAYKTVRRDQLREYLGVTVEADIPLATIMDEVKKLWDFYFILPDMSSYFHDEEVRGFWRNLIGQNLLLLDDPNGISELIACTIGLCENAVDIDTLSTHLTDVGLAPGTRDSVTKTLSVVANGRTLLPNAGKGTGLATV